MSITEQQHTILMAELPRDIVQKHPYTGFDYIRGCDAIEQANLIFGFDGWSYSVHSVERAGEVHKDHKGLYHVSYLATCSVDALGSKRMDVGFGVGVKSDPVDAAEVACKSAATDALKRCLRTFGNQFGNALYRKEEEQAVQSYQPPPQRHSQAVANPDPQGPLVNPRQPQPQKRCRHCGDPFSPPADQTWQTFCSKRCYAQSRGNQERQLPSPTTGDDRAEEYQTIHPDEVPF